MARVRKSKCPKCGKGPMAWKDFQDHWFTVHEPPKKDPPKWKPLKKPKPPRRKRKR